MVLDYIQRAYTHYSRFPNRKVAGIVLHHSAGSTAIDTYQSAGSWHWMVSKDRLYKDVSESYAAWHVGATDRWRPNWVPVGAGQGRTSDCNAVSIGIELVYAPQPPYNEMPNAYQYETLRALLADLYARYGELPIVGHGQLDTSRWPTEPHGLDWERAHCTHMRTSGRYFVAAIPEPEPEEPAMLDPHALTDAEIEHEVRPRIWADRYLPGSAEHAIPKRWRRAYQEGQYLGAPLANEVVLESGGVMQQFAAGCIVYKDGKVSVNG